jgi:hypoxanthine phosphoribosyltransferase
VTPAPRLLVGREEIAETVARLGAEITRDHPEGVVLVGVLKGALPFLADLARAVDRPLEVEFIALSRFAPDSGRVRILQDLQSDIAGRDVVLVEGMVDTGLTVAFLTRHLGAQGPRSLRVCALLDRAVRRIVPQAVDYRGLEVGEGWLLGYGFGYQELYRNLPSIYEGRRDDVAADPRCYLAALYGLEARAIG